MYIGSSGPRTARVAIVAEKPGREEVYQAKQTGNPLPLVGASGHEVDMLLQKIGTHRNSVYCTNAVKNVVDFTNPTYEQIREEQPALFKELLSLPNLNCIVAMGNAALQALSNFQLGMPKLEGKKEKGSGVTKYRGSILPTFFGKKMVPTFHPAYYMRGEWRFKPVVKFDLARALEESYDPNINVPNRRCYIAETVDDIRSIGEHFKQTQHISFDIELFKGRYIQCIAFSKDPSEAYCIPFANGRRQSIFIPEIELYGWKVVQDILNQERTCYVTQNGLFDCWHLWRHGIVTPYMAQGFDTMLAHRLRAPDLPHDLGFLVSIYTREPYYKDESGNWEEQDRSVSDDNFFAYNCKDAACTLEVAHELEKDLARNGMLDNFKTEVQAQWSAVTRMRQQGLKVDVAALQKARDIIARDILKDQELISKNLGWVPNTKSNIDMGKVYAQLKIKLGAGDLTKTGKPKTDVERLYSHAYANPVHRSVLYAIAGLNAKRTLQSGFTNIGYDQDLFYHPALDISKTKTGRLASKGADEGGPQIQNIPKRLRVVFCADDGDSEITNGDLAGAEAMIVAWITEDPLMIEAFLAKKKIHKVRACVIFRGWLKDELPPDDLLNSIKIVCPNCAAIGETECNHSEYYMAKQSGHAMAYREGIRRFCHEQRKRGVFIAESDAKFLQEKVVTKPLRDWHLRTENAVRKSPWIETALGRRRQLFGQYDDRLINQVLSWYCQALVGQITNRAMIYMDNEFDKFPNTKPRLITQTHDSLTTTHHKDLRPRIIEIYNKAFDQPIMINQRELRIPIEVTHGPNWGELK